MKNKKLLFAVIGAVIALCIALLVINYFSIYRSAERTGEYSFRVKGEKYRPVGIGFTKEGRTVAVVDGFVISEIPEDKDHNFLAVHSFLDNWTIVKESYVIPTEGKINVVYCENERITKGKVIDMAESIVNGDFQDSFVVKTKEAADIFNVTENIYIGYGDCPVGTDRIGAIGIINGKLVFVYAEGMANEDLIYTCYVLKNEYQGLYKRDHNTTFEVVTDN